MRSIELVVHTFAEGGPVFVFFNSYWELFYYSGKKSFTFPQVFHQNFMFRLHNGAYLIVRSASIYKK